MRRRLSPLMNEVVLNRPDGRTREARLLKRVRADVIEHLGGDAVMTPLRRAMVERAANLQLTCALFEEKMIVEGLTNYDNKRYLAAVNALSRVHRELEKEREAIAKPERPRPRTLAEALERAA